MPLQPPEPGWTWLKLPLNEAIDVTCMGEPHTWHTHWQVPPGGRRPVPVRCTRAETGDCTWCEAGHERRTRYVVPVLHDGALKLLEVGRLQFPTLAVCEQDPPWQGHRWRLVRERPHRNAPIVMRTVGRDAVNGTEPVDVGPFVATLGTDHLRLIDLPPRTPERSR